MLIFLNVINPTNLTGLTSEFRETSNVYNKCTILILLLTFGSSKIILIFPSCIIIIDARGLILKPKFAVLLWILL